MARKVLDALSPMRLARRLWPPLLFLAILVGLWDFALEVGYISESILRVVGDTDSGLVTLDSNPLVRAGVLEIAGSFERHSDISSILTVSSRQLSGHHRLSSYRNVIAY